MSYQSYQSHQQLQQQQQQQQQQQSQQQRHAGNGAWLQPSNPSSYQQRSYTGSTTVTPAYNHMSTHDNTSQSYQPSGLPSMIPYSASSYSQVGAPLYQQAPHQAQPSSASSASSSSSFLPMSAGHDSSHMGASHYGNHGYASSSGYHNASDDLYHQHAAAPVQHHPLDHNHLSGNGTSPGLGLGFPSGMRPKRRQVKNACVNCQKACKKCDEGRPCTRCVKYGLTDTCIDSMRKERKRGIKRGPYKRRATTGSTNAPSSATLPSPAAKANASFDSYHPPHQAYGIKHEPSSSSSSTSLASSLIGGSSNPSSYDSSSYAVSAPTSYRSAFVGSSGLGQQSASPQSMTQSPLLYNGREPSRSGWSATDPQSRSSQLSTHGDTYYSQGQHSGLPNPVQGNGSSGNGLASQSRSNGAGSPYFPVPSGLHSTQDGASGSSYLSAFNAGSGAMAQHQRVASEASSSTSGVTGGPGSSATNGSSLYSHSISSNSSSSTNGALASPRTPLALESSELSGVAVNPNGSSSYEGSNGGAQSYAKSPNPQSYGGSSGAQLPNMATMMRPFSLAMPSFPRSRAHYHQQHHGGSSHQQGDVSGSTAPIPSRV